MKLYAIVSVIFFSSFYLYTEQQDFLQNKLDSASVVMVDIVEVVQEYYVHCSQENIDQIKTQVHQLMQTAQDKKDTLMRFYSFITVSFVFTAKEPSNQSYIYYVLLCAEIDSFVLSDMSPEQMQNLEQSIINKLVGLYEAQKLAVEQVVPGCFVSCVQLGVEKIG